MAEVRQQFDDGAAYERFMGRWSRAVGVTFLDWLAPPKGARWLDVGCGTGIFTQLALDTCAPASIVAVDPAPAQIEHARKSEVAQRAEFRVADAQSLPFPDGTFDVVTSALVINFIPDRAKALAEMRRVSRRGGVVAGYVWDFAANRGTNAPIREGLRRVGADVPIVVGTQDSRLDALAGLFTRAGFSDIATRPIDIAVMFRDFDDLWQAQTPSFNPVTKTIAALSDGDRKRLIDTVRATLATGPDGSVSYPARANAIKARVPA
jgi:ubiquinone/menaquinone biosynthesis C-methylase UbiE